MLTERRMRDLERQAANYMPPAERLAVPSLLDFVPATTKGRVRPTHLARVAEVFERAERMPVRAVIHAPPRHGKTDIVQHAITRALKKRPKMTAAFLTYAQGLSNSKSIQMQRMAAAAGLVKGSPFTAREWRLPEGGGVLASAVKGGLTGQGVDLAVIDDYFKNRQDAESRVLRERIWDWFTDVVMTRIEPGGSVIVSATRWHPDDLQGRLIREGWEYIRLPAIDDTGAALWPERYSAADLADRRAAVGEYTWQSLFQGDPQPRGGRLFPEPLYWDALPGGIGARGLQPVAGFDLAYTAKTSSDYAVAFVGVTDGEKLYILDGWRGQVDSPAFMGILKTLDGLGRRMFGKPWTWRTYVSGTERGTINLLQTGGIDIYASTAVGDKFVRAQPVSAAAKRGAVLWPRVDYLRAQGRPVEWVAEAHQIIGAFTGVADVHDDDVDALSAIWDAASSGTTQGLAGAFGW